jgi:cytochrome P450 family 6
MSLVAIGILLLTLIYLIYRWIKKRYSFFEINKFPYVKPAFPFGNLKGAGTECHANELFDKLYTELKHKGPACGVYFFLTPNIMITDLDVIKDVLIRNFDNFHNRGLYSNERDDPLSANLFTIEDNEWKHMRTKLTPTFTSGKMKMMFNTIVYTAEGMVEELKSRDSLDMVEVRDTFVKFTVDVIGNVAFGLELNAVKDPNSQFHQMAMKVFKPSKNFFLRSFFLITFKKLGRALRMRFFPADVAEFFMGTIKETVQYRLANKVERNDFMNLLLKMYTEEEAGDEKFTLNQLAAQCFLFFVGGFETSSSASSFVLYNLAVHQDVQERLREEVKRVLAKHDDKISYEALNEMKYLQMVVDGECD